MNAVCNAAAFHVKKKINKTSRNKHIPITTNIIAVDSINKLGNHQSTTARISSTDLFCTTFKNIQKYFKFTAPVGENKIYAYENSNSENFEVYWDTTEPFLLQNF
jgi:hypothetical protein